jgi:hypothetical protein
MGTEVHDVDAGRSERVSRWLVPLGAFAGSRFLYVVYVLAIGALTAGPELIGGGRSFAQPWSSFLQPALFNSDSGFYHSIAVSGYAHVPFNTRLQYNWAFFPLYPWLTRWIGLVFGPGAVVPAGYAISSVSFLAALWVMWRWVNMFASAAVANLAVILAALSPLTPYFVAYRAASLFFLLSMLSLWAVARRQWGWAAFFGAAASLTRPTGILLAVPYLVGVWTETDKDMSWLRRLVTMAGAVSCGLGFVAVALIDQRVSGNPLAFLRIQAAWNRAAGFPFVAALRWLHHPLNALTAQGGWSLPLLALLISALAGLLALWMLRQRAWWPWAWYLGLVVILANASNSFEGIPRFIAEVPSLYFGLGAWAEATRAQSIVLAATVGFFGLYVALWVLGVHAVQS